MLSWSNQRNLTSRTRHRRSWTREATLFCKLNQQCLVFEKPSAQGAAPRVRTKSCGRPVEKHVDKCMLPNLCGCVCCASCSTPVVSGVSSSPRQASASAPASASFLGAEVGGCSGLSTCLLFFHGRFPIVQSTLAILAQGY